MFKYDSFIGLTDMPNETKIIMRKYGLIRFIASASFGIANTILTLFIIDNLGFKNASIVFTIMMATQLVLDYPSGSLSDWLGQRFILSSSFLLSAVGFFLLTLASNFNHYVLIAILFGIANSQSSGTLQSWLDNNYKKFEGDFDKDKKQYGYAMTRFQAFDTLVIGFAIVIGGMISSKFSRELVFFIQSILVLIATILTFKILKVNDSISPEQIIQSLDNTKPSYLDIIKNGLKFVYSEKTVFFFIIGIAIFQLSWTVWGTLLLFPIYFNYTGSDSGAGILRSLIFFTGVFIQIKLSNATRKVENNKLSLLIFVQGILCLGGAFTIFTLYPATGYFTLTGFILIFLLMTISISIFMPFISTIIQRMLIDLVPSEYRNSIYSLMPTIQGAFALALLPFSGFVAETYGLSSVIIICGVILAVSTLFIHVSIITKQKTNFTTIVKEDKPTIVVSGE
ncbi:MAG: MFS transporter [Candidatus Heimdallarchaeota archaeon]|nr:MFS transporter [Candidatus Heimdallarchaeota archaeon]MDH5646883.1 MFS transporter [Candidatus Heimdallarchaeota archaeon]